MTVILRRAAHQAVQGTQEVVVEFVRAVVDAAVEQAKFAVRAEAAQHTVDGVAVDLQCPSDVADGASFVAGDNDEVTGPQAGVAAAPKVLEQAFLDGEAKFGQDSGHGGSLLRARSPRSLMLREPPFSYPSCLSSTPLRCRIIAHGHLATA